MNYYALLVGMVLVTALMMHGTREKNLKYVIVACLLLYAVYGLRNTYYIGNDTTTSYLVNFNRMMNRDWDGVLDYAKGRNTLFYLMTKAFTLYISTDYQLYISVISAFVTLCFGVLVYKYSPNPLQSILYHFGLLYFTFHFSALKQSIAMALLMLAFDQIFEKKPIKFILIVLIAGQFHFPSLVFLPAYWVAKIQTGRAYLFLLAGLLVVTYIFRNQIINLMFNFYRDYDRDRSGGGGVPGAYGGGSGVCYPAAALRHGHCFPNLLRLQQHLRAACRLLFPVFRGVHPHGFRPKLRATISARLALPASR